MSIDLRGHGESSTHWAELSAEAIGSDILALIDELDTDHALVIGTSMSAGAAVWAAAEKPSAVSALVLIGPFVRDVGSPVQMRLYRTLFRLVLARPWGLVFWMRYWASLFPSTRPPDFDAYATQLRANLAERERFACLRKMMLGPSKREIEARLSKVAAPALVGMGTSDRDFKDPTAEAHLVAERLDAEVAMIGGAGHYPHVEYPEPVSRLILDFARASEQIGVAA